MSRIQFRDERWVRIIIYAERAKIAHARRMETDGRYDDLYARVIDALDLLLEYVTDEVDADAWSESVANVQAQLIFAAFKNSDRCDLFLEVSRVLSNGGAG